MGGERARGDGMTVLNFSRSSTCPRCQATVKIQVAGVVARIGIECVCGGRLVWAGFTGRKVFSQYRYVKQGRVSRADGPKYSKKADSKAVSVTSNVSGSGSL